MTGRFEGKVAFITGMARGQGRAHAVRLASEGADIIGVDICEQMSHVEYPMSSVGDLKETVRLVEEHGGRILAEKADVRDRSGMEQVLEAGLSQFGRLDYVLANAGVMPIHGGLAKTPQAWQDCLDVLLTGVMNTVELTYPRLVSQKQGGSIVITGSMAGTKPMMRTLEGHSLGLLGYSAAKAALVSLAQNYASILAVHGIRVNVVHPTGVNTDMIHNEMIDTYHATAHPEDRLVLVNAIPVRAVEVDDITSLVLWLCSDEARFFTGNAVRLDAGASLR